MRSSGSGRSRHTLAATGGFVVLLAGIGHAQVVPVQKLQASDVSLDDAYVGYALAADGDRVVVGAPNKSDAFPQSGAAYVFERTPSGWVQTAKLTEEADADSSNGFGGSVALDGDRIVVGAPGADLSPSVVGVGVVYVFDRTPSGWARVARLVSPSPDPSDWYGFDVAVDGDTVLASEQHDDGATVVEGRVYVYQRSGTSWPLVAELTARDPAAYDSFGTAIDVDGDAAIVGVLYDADNGLDSGSAWVFRRSAPGATTWVREAKLLASDGAAGDRFGGDVSISGDYAVVGASGDGSATGSDRGAAYVFRRTVSGWVEMAKLLPSDGGANAGKFGQHVALDGSALLVAANTLGAGSSAWAGYLFRRTGWIWVEQDRLTCPTLNYVPVDMGSGTAMIGAPLDGANDEGAAWLYELDVPTLEAGVFEASLSAGATQTLELLPGAEHAGSIHVLLGSLSGTVPGTPLPQGTLPLNVDAYTQWVLANPNSPVLQNSFGVLDAQGDAIATFVLPAGSPPGLVGSTVVHAYVVVSVPPSVDHISNAVSLAFRP